MKSVVKTRGLIGVTLMCCFFIMFLPNFDVLPDRRFSWVLNHVMERKFTKFECVLPSEDPEYTIVNDWEEKITNFTSFKNDSVFRAFISIAVFKNRSLRISSSSPGYDYVCRHQEIYDIDAGNRFVETDWSENFIGTLDVENISPHVHLYCTENSSGIQDDYFFELPPTAKRENVRKLKKIHSGHSSENVSTKDFSVMLISLSGLTRRDFASTMRRTLGFLKLDQHTVDMKFHSQNGFSRLLNMYSLLAGKPAREPKLISSTSSQPEFSEHLIWKVFHQRGFVTVSSEDDPEKGTLNFDNKHFKHVDFSTLALVQAYNHAKATHPEAKPRLIALNPGDNFYLDYASRLLRAFHGQRAFVYLGLSNITTHPVATSKVSFDYQLATFLRKMKTTRLLKNTLLFVMSDFAQTVPGRNPHVLPLYISLPKAFVRSYPMLYERLRNNSASVTTHMDVHATLLELASPADATRQEHCQSLFRLLSEQRPCEKILVPRSLCPCQTSPLP